MPAEPPIRGRCRSRDGQFAKDYQCANRGGTQSVLDASRSTRAITVPVSGRWGAESLVTRLEEQRWWGQIVGPHGVGKSTLLHALAEHRKRAGRNLVWCTLRAGQRQLPGELLHPAARMWPANTLVIVDGYEQLGWLARTRLKRRCRALAPDCWSPPTRTRGFLHCWNWHAPSIPFSNWSSGSCATRREPLSGTTCPVPTNSAGGMSETFFSHCMTCMSCAGTNRNACPSYLVPPVHAPFRPLRVTGLLDFTQTFKFAFVEDFPEAPQPSAGGSRNAKSSHFPLTCGPE